jgi:hypothetical protein
LFVEKRIILLINELTEYMFDLTGGEWVEPIEQKRLHPVGHEGEEYTHVLELGVD